MYHIIALNVCLDYSDVIYAPSSRYSICVVIMAGIVHGNIQIGSVA